MSPSTTELDHKVELLAAVRFCEGLSAEQLAVLAGKFTLRSFTAGETLASAGDEVTEFWIVVEGEIDSFVTDMRGREKLLGTIREGETVGEIVILEKTSTRPVRLTARTHGTLLTAPAALLHDWVNAYPRIVQNLFHTLSDRFKSVAGISSRKIPSPRLGIIAASRRAHLLLGRLASRLLAAGERLLVWTNDPAKLISAGAWPESLSIQTLAEGIAPLLHPAAHDIDRQIVIWLFDSSSRMEVERLQGCDELLWLIEPREFESTNRELQDAIGLRGELAQKVRVVWLLDADVPVAPVSVGWKFEKSDIKVPVASDGGALNRLERQGLDRLVRSLRGISLGIALAGGGAKGMAHFGVLRALEAAGLTFDVMSGTSAGAMAGILYASGMSPEDAVTNFERDLKPSQLFRYLPKWPNLYLVSQYRRRKWDGMLRRYLHDWQLEQLPIPFNAVTVDLVQVNTLVRRQGDAVHAILESINLPIVSQPILRDGMALVDGGVLNNLPADVLVEQGADFVVGVDVSSRVRNEFAGNRPNTPTGKMKNAGVLDTLFRIFESQAYNMGKFRNRAVDFWIKPDTSGFGLAEFHRTAEIAAAGEAAASGILAELKQRLVDLEARLLNRPRT